MPRWVKVSLVITAVVIVAFVILAVAGGGGHGPGRHLPGGGHGPTPAPSVTPVGSGPDGDVSPGGRHTRPPGGH